MAAAYASGKKNKGFLILTRGTIPVPPPPPRLNHSPRPRTRDFGKRKYTE